MVSKFPFIIIDLGWVLSFFHIFILVPLKIWREVLKIGCYISGRLVRTFGTYKKVIVKKVSRSRTRYVFLRLITIA